MLAENAGINGHGQKTSRGGQTSPEQQQLIGKIDTGKIRYY